MTRPRETEPRRGAPRSASTCAMQAARRHRAGAARAAAARRPRATVLRREPRATACAATADASQLVVVEAPSRSRRRRRRRRSGSGPDGCFAQVGGPWPARLGWHGLSSHHLEGDGTTPIGAFGIGPEMYGVAPDPGARLPLPPPGLRRLVGRGPDDAELQPLRPRPLRRHGHHSAAAARRCGPRPPPTATSP